MAYPGEYRREQYYGEDGYVEGGEYNGRGYATEAGYGAPYGSEGYGARPYSGEQYEHHKHGHHQPEVVYVQPGESDLGTGLSGGLRPESYGGGYGGGYGEGYGAGYGRNQPGYAAPGAYGAGGYQNNRNSGPKINKNEEYVIVIQSTPHGRTSRVFLVVDLKKSMKQLKFGLIVWQEKLIRTSELPAQAQVERLEEELQVERRRAHEAEAAAAAATAYAVHERHERKEEEEEQDRYEPYGERKQKHHFFGLD